MRRAIVTAVVLGVVITLAFSLRDALAPVTPVACTTTANNLSVVLSPEQTANAATIAGVAVRRGLPPRAATIAIATAMQESKLVNLAYGDLDSLGLFQQRPSQGWGTRAQVLDPVHSANAFYDALVKIKGYGSMSITAVAQQVQHSGYPQAYAQHEPQARALASALTGYSPAALTCALDPSHRPAGSAGPGRLSEAMVRDQPPHPATALAGRAGVRVRTGAGAPAWAFAQWSVARADQLGVARVYVDGQVWSRAGRDQGWTPAAGPGVPAKGSGEVVVLFTDTTPA